MTERLPRLIDRGGLLHGRRAVRPALRAGELYRDDTGAANPGNRTSQPFLRKRWHN